MSAQFQEIHNRAWAAGLAALAACTPTPMVVSDNRSGQQWYVADGACGFAWVSFAGNTPWGRWAKQAGIASRAYPKGLMVWVGEGDQSIGKKEAFASAYAKVLNEAGIKAYAHSRLD